MRETKITELVGKHSEYRRNCFNMIPSESIMSPAVRRVLSCDLGARYTGAIYSGNKFYKEIEETCSRLLKKIFKAKYVNLKPATGMIANMASLYAATAKGDLVLSVKEEYGAHYSHLEYHSRYGHGTPYLLGIQTGELPSDEKEYNIDVGAAIRQIKKTKPKAIILGTTSFLFPAPIKELRDACDEVETGIIYDGAQVAGLIAGGQFQKPLEEGADLFSTSTNKTLCGPAHGLIMADKPENFKEKLDDCINSMTTSIYHLHHIAGLAIALEESERFGKKFAKQIIRNSKALAKSLYENGIDAQFEHKGFTSSHIALVDMKTDSLEYVKKLEKNNIIASTWVLPKNKTGPMTGIRFGTTELTRLGFKEKDMAFAGELVAKCLLKEKTVKHEIVEIMKNKTKCHYCFEESKTAYEMF